MPRYVEPQITYTTANAVTTSQSGAELCELVVSVFMFCLRHGAWANKNPPPEAGSGLQIFGCSTTGSTSHRQFDASWLPNAATRRASASHSVWRWSVSFLSRPNSTAPVLWVNGLFFATLPRKNAR